MSTSKKGLILLASSSMDNNKKEDRNEHGLIRMSSKARTAQGFSEDAVEIWSQENDVSTNANGALMLTIFKSYSEDIKRMKKLIAEGKLEPADVSRIGFVTSKTYKRITGKEPDIDRTSIWISKDVVDIVLGADPEFILMDKGGNIISANQVNGFTHYGSVAYDGAMAEFRPKPDVSPEGLVNNIRDIMKDEALTASIKNYDWMAGVFYKNAQRAFPIGGHIHIGNPIKIARIKQGARELFFKAFNKVLDELLALPAIRLDGAKGKDRRTIGYMGKYGFFGEYRLCNGRLEYRTLSGVWLSHPVIAELVFGTAKAIIEEVYGLVAANDFKESYICSDICTQNTIWQGTFNRWHDIPLTRDMQCVKPSRDMIDFLNNSSNRKANKTFIESWYKRMKAMSTYKANAKYIDGLYTLLSHSNKDLAALTMSLKPNWLEGKELSVKL